MRIVGVSKIPFVQLRPPLAWPSGGDTEAYRSRSRTRLSRCLLVLLFLAALPARAQEAETVDAVSVRALGDRDERVKTTDGGTARRRSTLVYDPVAGEYVRTTYDRSGLVLDRTVRRSTMVGPSPAEERTAQALIRSDDELAALIASSNDAVTVSGGFPLVREEGHACGPGSRCLMYDVFAVSPPARRGARAVATRLRFVVVDLRAVRLLSNDFDAARDGNFANPEIRARSRARDSR